MPLDAALGLSPTIALGAVVAAAFVSVIAIARRREARLRAAQAALRISEERHRLALEASTEIVWDWDLATDRMELPRFAQAYGYPI